MASHFAYNYHLMTPGEHFWHSAFSYYGVDWMITLTVFTGIFLLGEKKKEGFIVAMTSSIFGLVFSYQIGSIANAVTAVVLFLVYLRGYLLWLKGEDRTNSKFN